MYFQDADYKINHSILCNYHYMNYKNDFQHSGRGFEDFLTLLAVGNSLSLHLSGPLSRHRYPRMAFATEALWVIFCCVYTAAHTDHVSKAAELFFASFTAERKSPLSGMQF